MVDAVEEEMRCDGDTVVWEVAVVLSVTCHPMKSDGEHSLVQMEQTPVEHIFNNRPEA